MPTEVQEDEELRKYWAQRYRLFSKYDDGVQMDKGTIFTFIFDMYELDINHIVIYGSFHEKGVQIVIVSDAVRKLFM